ncbi:MAG: hypothetical protein E6929_08040 [Clostridium sp.]|nr:hypothetical protein [Clostridium sp.]
MKSKIIFFIGFMMFFLGSYFSDKYSIVAVIAILGAMIMGSSFLFSTNKKSNS